MGDGAGGDNGIGQSEPMSSAYVYGQTFHLVVQTDSLHVRNKTNKLFQLPCQLKKLTRFMYARKLPLVTSRAIFRVSTDVAHHHQSYL